MIDTWKWRAVDARLRMGTKRRQLVEMKRAERRFVPLRLRLEYVARDRVIYRGQGLFAARCFWRQFPVGKAGTGDAR